MGGSGLLLVGVVVLWVFGAVPHWVRRSEVLAADHAAADPAAQRTVTARPRPDRWGDAEAWTSSSGILRRARSQDVPPAVAASRSTAPVTQRSTVPAATAAAPRRDGRAPARAARPRPAARAGMLAVAVLAAVVAVAGGLLLVPGGPSATTVALVALAVLGSAVVTLRLRARRAAVRRRALARRRAAARPRLVPSSVAARAHRRSAAQAPGNAGADAADADEMVDRRRVVGA